MKTKIILSLIACLSVLLIISCADGTDSVDFSYSPNSTDIKTINFKAFGKSDFGNFEYSWNFGDGEKSLGQNVSHTFEKFGKYNVILTATIEKSNIITEVQKEIEIEVPIINNIKITGKPSSKGANIIEYTVSSESEYENEIEYNWQFDDGTTATGIITIRDMPKWPNGDGSGFITDRVFISAYIPSLDYTYRVKDPIEVQIEKPKINNFSINCTNEGTASQDIFNCNVRKGGVNPTATVGHLTYEWSFNGDVRAGDTQTFILTKSNYDYPVYVTATIDGTNISETRKATINYSTNENDINFSCNTAIVNDNHEDALKVICKPKYVKGKFKNPTLSWDMGNNKSSVDTTGDEVVEYTYNQAGVYNIVMEFKAENLSKPLKIEKKETVLVNLSTWSNTYDDKKAGSHLCKDGSTYFYRQTRTFNNNYNNFRQEDFDLYSSFSTRGYYCKGQENGWNKGEEINKWYVNGTETGTNWGGWTQNGVFTLCPKGENKKSKKCIHSSF